MERVQHSQVGRLRPNCGCVNGEKTPTSYCWKVAPFAVEGLAVNLTCHCGPLWHCEAGLRIKLLPKKNCLTNVPNVKSSTTATTAGLKNAFVLYW